MAEIKSAGPGRPRRYARSVLARRMLLLVALLMGLGAVAASVSPDRRSTQESPSPTPTAVPGDQAAVPPAEQDARDIDALPDEAPIQTLDTAGDNQVVHVAIDETLRLHVSSDRLDSVQLGEDGPIEIVTPEAPARFELLVDQPLDLDVRLLESGRVIGRVTTSD
jgi:hypothetical protein